MNEKLRNLLYESFDRDLSKEERKTLDTALRDSKELRQEKKEITEIRKKLTQHQITTKLSKDFTDTVLASLDEEDDLNEKLFYQFKRMAIAAVALFALMFAFNDVFSPNSSDLLSDSSNKNLIESVDSYMSEALYGEEK